jgi:hypothetical protein
MARVKYVRYSSGASRTNAPLNLPQRNLRFDRIPPVLVFYRFSACAEMGAAAFVRNLAGETLNVNAHWFVPAVRAAGIKDFVWHDTRHCFASRLRQAGVPLGHIGELLGHKGLAMTKRYAHLSIFKPPRGGFPYSEQHHGSTRADYRGSRGFLRALSPIE